MTTLTEVIAHSPARTEMPDRVHALPGLSSDPLRVTVARPLSQTGCLGTSQYSDPQESCSHDVSCRMHCSNHDRPTHERTYESWKQPTPVGARPKKQHGQAEGDDNADGVPGREAAVGDCPLVPLGMRHDPYGPERHENRQAANGRHDGKGTK